jgi:hypothetical protein
MAIAYSVSNSFVSVLSWDSVVGAKNLDEIKEWFARQDPYVVIEYGPNKFRTRTDTGLVLHFSVCLSMHPLEHPHDAQYVALHIKIG